MLKEYIVDLKYDKYIKTFERFLKCHNIKYEVLDDLGMFLVTVTPMCASFINSLSYIDDISENQNIPAQEIKPISSTSFLKSKKLNLNIQNDIAIKSSNSDEIWFRDATGVSTQWEKGVTGKGIKVAVIDSGIERNHKGLNVSGYVNFTQFSQSLYDSRGSGTIAAGIIAARGFELDVKGVAYDCELYSVKIVEDNGDISLWSMYEAIEWCIDNNINVAAITISIRPQDVRSRYALQNLSEAIGKADKKGTIVVGPVGQENAKQVNIPASIDGAFSLTGVQVKPNTTPSLKNIKLLTASNIGRVDFSAPGANISTTFLNNQYVSNFEGSGIACAYFSGGCALLLSEDRTRTSDDVFAILRNNVTRTPQFSYSEGGYGLAYYALRSVDIPG